MNWTKPTGSSIYEYECDLLNGYIVGIQYIAGGFYMVHLLNPDENEIEKLGSFRTINSMEDLSLKTKEVIQAYFFKHKEIVNALRMFV